MASAPDFEYVDLVGHSMGGLIAIYMLKGLDRGRHIRQVITLGTPHRGTPAAMAGVLPPHPTPPGSQIVSIHADGDALVPERCSRLPRRPGQYNAKVRNTDHIALLYSTPTFELVTRGLGAA